jgi:hypothetical protein
MLRAYAEFAEEEAVILMDNPYGCSRGRHYFRSQRKTRKRLLWIVCHRGHYHAIVLVTVAMLAARLKKRLHNHHNPFRANPRLDLRKRALVIVNQPLVYNF